MYGRRRAGLEGAARSVLAFARREARAGFERHDDRRVRDAAEKAWLAGVQAVDGAMARHGRVPEPGRGAHGDRHAFLEAIGRRDLSRDLSYFADRLHGECFYFGACPDARGMEAALNEVRRFVERLAAEA
jgi:hypothetical protein